MAPRERIDQKRRTRRDLLQAAARLMKEGTVPTMAQVAEGACVSRATAYRHFPSEKALLREASLDSMAPPPEQLFAGDASTDLVERLLKANAALHRTIWGNQNQFRLLLAQLLEQAASTTGVPVQPLRQNRRMNLIEAALAPARHRFPHALYRKLCSALALVFGTESMVVFQDVLQIDDPEASAIEEWTVRALTQAALHESKRKKTGARAQSSPIKAKRAR